MILEISIRIGTDTFPSIVVPIGDKGNGLIDVMVSLVTSAIFLVSHEVLVVTGWVFQDVGSDQIEV